MALIDHPDMIANQIRDIKSASRKTQRNKNIKDFVHDRDTNAFKLVHDAIGWDVKERLDFTHATKSWKKMFNTRKMLTLNGNKRRTNILGSLKESFLRRFHVS